MRVIRRRLGCLVAWAVLSLVSPASAVERTSAFRAALDSISHDQLQQHVDFLADDALEGREAGTAGATQAADYLAARLDDLGLRGAGGDGSFFQPFEPSYRNVLAVIEGSDPDLKRQHVVVGAHYDHIGLGTRRNSRGPVGQIHNGADDNASGTSGLLELAEAFTMLPTPPKRSILLAFWDAEEKGMLGSKHWTAHPTVPLEQVVAALNVDMIGRLRDDRLYVYGSRLGYGWRRLVSEENDDSRLLVEFPRECDPNSDHWPFVDRGIPVLMLHTGVHDEYHRPTDKAHLIHAEGMRRVTRLLFALAYDLADRSELPAFRAAGRHENDAKQGGLLAQNPPRPDRLGITWDRHGPSGRGVRISGVRVGSAADLAGIRPGDRIVEVAGRPIRDGDGLVWAVASAPNAAGIVVERTGRDAPLHLTAELEGTPLRLGITWHVDDAEPGTVVLTHVVAGSPAARAGLQAGDRVYQIAGRDFADETEFARWAAHLPAPLQLVIERDGRLHSVELRPQSETVRQAA